MSKSHLHICSVISQFNSCRYWHVIFSNSCIKFPSCLHCGSLPKIQRHNKPSNINFLEERPLNNPTKICNDVYEENTCTQAHIRTKSSECLEDEEEGLQTWRSAANVLNNQSRTADSSWSTRLRVWPRANNSLPHVVCYKMLNWTSGLDGLFEKCLCNILKNQSWTMWSGLVWLRIGTGVFTNTIIN